MIPRQPPRRPQMGFLFIPPFRIQGLSVAGEETVVHVPELDVVFDIGLCPRPVLAAKYVALSHGHMDHAAAISYYFSQRHFQGMGVGNVICHPALADPIHNVMKAWIDLERQRTPYQVIAVKADEEVEVKNNHFLRAFETAHTAPSLGFVMIERRSKLRPELTGLPQEHLVELKQKGQQITQTIDVPRICYLGDTMWGPHFDRPDVLESEILITECTFTSPADRDRASVGKHLHLSDIIKLLKQTKAKAVVLTHLSRRSTLTSAWKQIELSIPEEDRQRLYILMDHRTNRNRYEQQQQKAEELTVE